ncbi:MAG: HypC/HybG/HupF family hydrogenase formation chaperone [Actinobacteria bacterium]|nr:MAG: HypC/HybG/HupF family hydrogenase formation chaperone [Actinomycetota bacterium]
MCLGVPGKITSIQDMGGLAIAEVDISGVKRQVSLDLVPEAEEGQYVLVHAGFAIQIIDEQEAEETLKLLEDLTGVELPESS